ncbi:MAG: hypothetical protein ACREAC_01190, partial [Blastocatellia bacterium]
GRALLAIDDFHLRLELARKIARGGMTVRQVERYAARRPRAKASPAVSQIEPNTRAALEELQRLYGTRVLSLRHSAGKPGQLIFEYYDDSDMVRLYDQLMR